MERYEDVECVDRGKHTGDISQIVWDADYSMHLLDNIKREKWTKITPALKQYCIDRREKQYAMVDGKLVRTKFDLLGTDEFYESEIVNVKSIIEILGLLCSL